MIYELRRVPNGASVDDVETPTPLNAIRPASRIMPCKYTQGHAHGLTVT